MTARLILSSENERTSMYRTVYVLGVIVASGAILALPHGKSNPGPISRLSAHALHEAAYAALRSPGVSTGRE